MTTSQPACGRPASRSWCTCGPNATIVACGAKSRLQPRHQFRGVEARVAQIQITSRGWLLFGLGQQRVDRKRRFRARRPSAGGGRDLRLHHQVGNQGQDRHVHSHSTLLRAARFTPLPDREPRCRCRSPRSAGMTKILPSPMLPSGPVRATLDQRVDRALEKVVVDDDFQRDLAQQVGLVLVAAIVLGLAALPAEALRVADGHPRDADLGQRLAHGAELRRLNDGDHHSHRMGTLSSPWLPLAYRRAAVWQTARHAAVRMPWNGATCSSRRGRALRAGQVQPGVEHLVDPAGGFLQVGPAVGVELGVALEHVVDPAFERRQLGVGHGLAILRAHRLRPSPAATAASDSRAAGCAAGC